MNKYKFTIPVIYQFQGKMQTTDFVIEEDHYELAQIYAEMEVAEIFGTENLSKTSDGRCCAALLPTHIEPIEQAAHSRH